VGVPSSTVGFDLLGGGSAFFRDAEAEP